MRAAFQAPMLLVFAFLAASCKRDPGTETKPSATAAPAVASSVSLKDACPAFRARVKKAKDGLVASSKEAPEPTADMKSVVKHYRDMAGAARTVEKDFTAPPANAALAEASSGIHMLSGLAATRLEEFATALESSEAENTKLTDLEDKIGKSGDALGDVMGRAKCSMKGPPKEPGCRALAEAVLAAAQTGAPPIDVERALQGTKEQGRKLEILATAIDAIKDAPPSEEDRTAIAKDVRASAAAHKAFAEGLEKFLPLRDQMRKSELGSSQAAARLVGELDAAIAQCPE